VTDTPPGPGWWQASDGKWYSPEQAPAQPAAQPTTPAAAAPPAGAPSKTGMSGCLIAFLIVAGLGLVGFIGLIVAISVLGNAAGDRLEQVAEEFEESAERQRAREAATAAVDAEHPPRRDVEVLSCSSDDSGFVTVEIVITNHTPTTNDYAISLRLEDGSGTRLGSGFASHSSVEPDERVEVEGFGSVNSPSGELEECDVDDVQRYPS